MHNAPAEKAPPITPANATAEEISFDVIAQSSDILDSQFSVYCVVP